MKENDLVNKETQEKLLREVRSLAVEAGRRAMRFYGQTRSDSIKADNSPVTAADIAAHEYLIASIAPLQRDVTVISEESAPSAAPEPGTRFWLIDPLDGTKEFIKGTGEFTVNIALIEGGRPVLGVVHAPALDQTYFARQGAGAWVVESGSSARRIRCRRWNPEDVAIVASKEHSGPMVAQLLQEFPNSAVKSMGSSLKFCLVAEGKADIYLRDVPTMEWDTAAAQCIVEAAGGQVLELTGQPLSYGKRTLKNPSILTLGDVEKSCVLSLLR